MAPSTRRQDKTTGSLAASAPARRNLVGLQVIRSFRSPPTATILVLAQSRMTGPPRLRGARNRSSGYRISVHFRVPRGEDSECAVDGMDGVAGALRIGSHRAVDGASWLGDFWVGPGGGGTRGSSLCCCWLLCSVRFRSSARNSGLFQCGIGTASI